MLRYFGSSVNKQSMAEQGRHALDVEGVAGDVSCGVCEIGRAGPGKDLPKEGVDEKSFIYLLVPY
jgi:hypothetical protein